MKISSLFQNAFISSAMLLTCNVASALELPQVNITKVQVYSAGTVGFYIDTSIPNPANCSSIVKLLIAEGNGENYLLSTLLAAKVAGETVSIQISDSNCRSAYPVATRITMG